jgi:hypothetical protein
MLGASRQARQGTLLLLLSIAFHAGLLAALAWHAPTFATRAGPPAMAVVLVAPPLVRARAVATPQTQAHAHRPRIVGPAHGEPRYAAAAAPTGEATDAVDLFGPVFADGLWPRPVRVGRAPCDAQARERDPGCERDVMLIGLASGSPARSNAAP